MRKAVAKTLVSVATLANRASSTASDPSRPITSAAYARTCSSGSSRAFSNDGRASGSCRSRAPRPHGLAPRGRCRGPACSAGQRGRHRVGAPQRLSRLHPNQGIVVREQGQEGSANPSPPSRPAPGQVRPDAGIWVPQQLQQGGNGLPDPQLLQVGDRGGSFHRGAVPAEGDQRRDLCPSVHSLIPCWPSSRGSRGPSGSR